MSARIARSLPRRSALLVSLMACTACSTGARGPAPSAASPGVVFPTTLGEGHNDVAPPAPADSAASAEPAAEPPLPAAAPAAVPPHGGPPDPEPLRLKNQWEYEFEWNGGKLSVLSSEPKRFPKPIVTARRFGRFAVELWIGHELVERVRFDFPGLEPQPIDSGTRKRLRAPPDFSKGAEVRQRVLVPAAPRARRAELVDRATGSVLDLPWPPDHPIPPPASVESTPVAPASVVPVPAPNDTLTEPKSSVKPGNPG